MTKVSKILSLVALIAAFDTVSTRAVAQEAGEIAVRREEKAIVLRKTLEAAATAAILLSLPEIQATTYGAAGGQPGNLVAWKNGALNDHTLNFFRNTLRTLERAWVRPRVLGWPDVQYQSSLVIHRALTSKQVNASVVAEIAATYEKYVKE